MKVQETVDAIRSLDETPLIHKPNFLNEIWCHFEGLRIVQRIPNFCFRTRNKRYKINIVYWYWVNFQRS